MEIRPLEKTPQNIGEIWRKIVENRERMPNGEGASLDLFVRTALAPDTAIFELGDWGGVLIVTDITPPGAVGVEIIARPHILIWDRACYGAAAELRAFAAAFMRERKTYRLVAEFSETAAAARVLAEKVGFRRVGKFRKRIRPADGQVVDTLIYDALLEDIELAARRAA